MQKPIVFFDFDGTLCFDKYWRSLPPEAYSTAQEMFFGSDRTILNDWMLGKYSSEDINAMLAPVIELPYEELWDLFIRDCSTMSVASVLLSEINSLRKHYTCILVTGNMDSFTRFTLPALRLEDHFDHINNSFFEGTVKRDDNGQTFTDYAIVLSVPVTDCFLIDDSETTCELFTSLGGTAYQVTSLHPALEHIAKLIVTGDENIMA